VAPVVNDPPSQEDAIGGNPGAAAGQQASNTIGSMGITTKTVPVPTHDPLPVRKGRNTHPGLAEIIQPAPRQSPQEVAAKRNRKRLELQEKLHAVEEAKVALVQMELEEDRLVEGFEEECHQQLDHRQKGKTLTIMECKHEEFDLNGIEDTEDDEKDVELEDGTYDDKDEDTGKEKVSCYPTSNMPSITYQCVRVKQNEKTQRCWQGLHSAVRLRKRQQH
jgi:hypothetical protein